jgi:hypothetical protein
MKRLVITVCIVLSLGACANLKTAWQVATSASVSPTQIIVAGNAFDAAEASATQFLLYCKANAVTSACALPIRRKIVAAVRAGRTARNGLEPYVTSGTAGPSALFNVLINSINTLQTNLPAAQSPGVVQ